MAVGRKTGREELPLLVKNLSQQLVNRDDHNNCQKGSIDGFIILCQPVGEINIKIGFG